MAPDVADARWCRPRRLRGQPPLQLTSVGRKIPNGNFRFRRSWGSLTPAVDVVGILVLLSASPVGFRFRLLCSRNSSLDGGAVIMILAVSPFAAPSLKTAVKSCSCFRDRS
jgi:hypothetical protein